MKIGFTLAEVLITLGIIGVVASMTLPSVVSKHKEKEMLVRLKYSVNILNNAFRLAVADYGDMQNWDYVGEFTNDEKRKIFIDKYLIPYIKGASSSGQSGYDENGLGYTSSSSPRQPNGTHVGLTSVKYYPITMLNGIFFYAAHGDSDETLQIRVDLNGLQKPNIFGYDLFALELVPQKNSVYATGYNDPSPMSFCTPGNAWMCAAAIIKNNYKIPEKYPVKF